MIKKILVYIFLLLFFSSITYFITAYNYQKYLNNYNYFTANILALSQSGELSEQEILAFLQSNETFDYDFFVNYGYNELSDFTLKSTDELFINNLIFNLCIVNLLVSVIFLFCNYYLYLKNAEYKNISKQLKKIDNLDYNLDIKEFKEGKSSLLKNEIYNITLKLKEKSEKLFKEKKQIKDNINDISHQLKTPLTGINVLLDNILNDSDMSDEIKSEFLTDIKMKTESIEFLIESLLKLSKFDADVISFEEKNINVSSFLENITNSLSYLSIEKNIDITINSNKKICFSGDLKWQSEAIKNILKNAIEHSEYNSKIEIVSSENNFFTQINIKDYGKGIKTKDLKYIFDRFYKSENSNDNSIGIGLNLAKTIITKGNGYIYLVSKENEGTEFIIKYFK